MIFLGGILLDPCGDIFYILILINRDKEAFLWQTPNVINVPGGRNMIKIPNRSWAVSGAGISTGVPAGRPI
jgi:hypothetical protein